MAAELRQVRRRAQRQDSRRLVKRPRALCDVELGALRGDAPLRVGEDDVPGGDETKRGAAEDVDLVGEELHSRAGLDLDLSGQAHVIRRDLLEAPLRGI